MSKLDKLSKQGKGKYSQKVLQLFVKAAGEKLDEAVDYAQKAVDSGYKFERALANALDYVNGKSTKIKQNSKKEEYN